MFELKTLNKWMEDYENAIYNKLTRTKKLYEAWHQACKEQKTLDVNGYKDDPNSVEIPEMRQCCCWKISPRWEKKEIKIYDKTGTLIIETIEVEGDEIENLVYAAVGWETQKTNAFRDLKDRYNGLKTLITKFGCAYSEVEWVASHDDNQIRGRAHKEMLAFKADIERRVEKICGKELTNIDEGCEGIYAKGSNGRTAHLWAIYAGGYNIQCLHVRVLVKEVK